MYDKAYSEDGSFVSYMGPYRAQNTITMNVRMTDMADPEYYPSRHEVTVKGPETRNSEAAVWLAGHDSAAVKEHVKETFGNAKETLLQWVEAAKKIEAENPGIGTKELYKKTDVELVGKTARFSGREITAKDTSLTEEQFNKYIKYVNNALTGPNINDKPSIHTGIVSPELIEALKKHGHVLAPNAHSQISDNNIRHVRKSHGITKTNKKGIESVDEYGINDGDVRAIPFILKNAQRTYYREGKNGILYVYDDIDTTYYVEEILSESVLEGREMVKVPLGAIPDLYVDDIKKEKALTVSPDELSLPRAYVQDVTPSRAFKDSLPQNSDKSTPKVQHSRRSITTNDDAVAAAMNAARKAAAQAREAAQKEASRNHGMDVDDYIANAIYEAQRAARIARENQRRSDEKVMTGQAVKLENQQEKIDKLEGDVADLKVEARLKVLEERAKNNEREKKATATKNVLNCVFNLLI